MDTHPAEATAREAHVVSTVAAHEVSHSTEADLAEVATEGLSLQKIFLAHDSVVLLNALVVFED